MREKAFVAARGPLLPGVCGEAQGGAEEKWALFGEANKLPILCGATQGLGAMKNSRKKKGISCERRYNPNWVWIGDGSPCERDQGFVRRLISDWKHYGKTTLGGSHFTYSGLAMRRYVERGLTSSERRSWQEYWDAKLKE